MNLDNRRDEKHMPKNQNKALSLRQKMAFELTSDQLAAATSSHSLESLSFPKEIQMSEDDFKKFLDAIKESRSLNKVF